MSHFGIQSHIHLIIDMEMIQFSAVDQNIIYDLY